MERGMKRSEEFFFWGGSIFMDENALGFSKMNAEVFHLLILNGPNPNWANWIPPIKHI